MWSSIVVPTLWLSNVEGIEALARELQRQAISDQPLRQLSEVMRGRQVTSASTFLTWLQGQVEALSRAARHHGRDAARDLRALTQYGYLPAYVQEE
eukprot:14564053-Alexandrium_andersonii.AAC.1